MAALRTARDGDIPQYVIQVDEAGNIAGAAAGGALETGGNLATLTTTVGAKTDAKSTATDATSVSAMSVWKQISASVQAIATSIASLVTGTVLAAGAAIIGKVGIDQTTPGTTNGVTDNGPGWSSVFGVAGVPFASADQHSAVASVTDAPTSGKKLVITDLVLSVDTAMTVTFKEETSGTIMFGPWYCSAAGGPVQLTLRGKKKLATADKKLQVITSVAGNITVQAGYYSET